MINYQFNPTNVLGSEAINYFIDRFIGSDDGILIVDVSDSPRYNWVLESKNAPAIINWFHHNFKNYLLSDDGFKEYMENYTGLLLVSDPNLPNAAEEYAKNIYAFWPFMVSATNSKKQITEYKQFIKNVREKYLQIFKSHKKNFSTSDNLIFFLLQDGLEQMFRVDTPLFHAVLYLNDLLNKNPRHDLSRISYTQALDGYKNSFKKMEDSLIEGKDIYTVMEFDDGARWNILISQKAYDNESNTLEHCVGRFNQYRRNTVACMEEFQSHAKNWSDKIDSAYFILSLQVPKTQFSKSKNNKKVFDSIYEKQLGNEADHVSVYTLEITTKGFKDGKPCLVIEQAKSFNDYLSIDQSWREYVLTLLNSFDEISPFGINRSLSDFGFSFGYPDTLVKTKKEKYGFNDIGRSEFKFNESSLFSDLIAVEFEYSPVDEKWHDFHIPDGSKDTSHILYRDEKSFFSLFDYYNQKFDKNMLALERDKSGKMHDILFTIRIGYFDDLMKAYFGEAFYKGEKLHSNLANTFRRLEENYYDLSYEVADYDREELVNSLDKKTLKLIQNENLTDEAKEYVQEHIDWTIYNGYEQTTNSKYLEAMLDNLFESTMEQNNINIYKNDKTHIYYAQISMLNEAKKQQDEIYAVPEFFYFRILQQWLLDFYSSKYYLKKENMTIDLDYDENCCNKVSVDWQIDMDAAAEIFKEYLETDRLTTKE